MTTTEQQSAASFIGTYPNRTAERWFAARLLCETRYEQTEAYIACVAESCGCSLVAKDAIIDAALDAGLVRSTVTPRLIPGGVTHIAALVRV